MAPIFFDYKRTPLTLKKTQIALDAFNIYLHKLGSKYAAGGNSNHGETSAFVKEFVPLQTT